MTSQPYPIMPVTPYESEGWLLDEDRALRDLIKGIEVNDHHEQKRRVEVWFGYPDQELREQKYPYITVDLINIQEGVDRVHRGYYYVGGGPEWWGLEPLTGKHVGYEMEMPTPVDLDYQISTWSRNPRHDRQILQQMITGGRGMLRAGMVRISDGTYRRLDVLDVMKRDMVEGGKRLFNNAFRVRISSEVPWGAIQTRNAYPFARIDQVAVAMDALDFNHHGDSPGLVKTSIRSGVIIGWTSDKPAIADVSVSGYAILNMPVNAKIQPYGLYPGDFVSVKMDPLVPDPTTPADYSMLVIEVEKRAEQ